MQIRMAGLTLSVGMLCLPASGCKDKEKASVRKDPATAATPPGASAPSAQVGAACTIPPIPTIPGTAQVVGDGTPASCTPDALQAALGKNGPITFKCGEQPLTIKLEKELVVDRLDSWTSLDGEGKITLSGQGRTRILRAGQKSNLLVRNLRFIDGSMQGGTDLKGSGGALYGGLRAELHVVNCTFENNVALGTGEVGGGALYSRGGIGAKTFVVDSTFLRNKGNIGGAIDNLLTDLTVVNSTFEENEAEGDKSLGGAIYTDGANSDGGTTLGKNNGLISVCGSRFVKNIAKGQGGGVFLYTYGRASLGQSDRVEVRHSVFEGNQVTGQGKSVDGFDGLGGGLRTGTGKLTLSDSTFVDNTAGSQGGGIWIGESAAADVVNVTLFRNKARSSDGKGGMGGAIFPGDGSVTISNSTIAANEAGFQGGAIFGGKDKTKLQNTILFKNTADNPWNVKLQCLEPLVDGGNNILFPDKETQDPSDNNCVAGIKVADPLLAETLLETPGHTPTLPLSAGSPAIDAANPSLCPTQDQRGASRSGPCDAGAFEFTPH